MTTTEGARATVIPWRGPADEIRDILAEIRDDQRELIALLKPLAEMAALRFPRRFKL